MNIEKQFAEIRSLIKKAKANAYHSVNVHLIDLYWEIGRFISEKIQSSDWGEGIVNNLSEYLSRTEPEMKGFSAQNLWRMKQFYETYYVSEKLSPLVREISWTNNLIILSKTNKEEEREFYLRLTISEKLSKRELERQKDYFVDLLFYNRELQCLVAIDLKINDFKPEYFGKLEFYLEALDRDVKKEHEKPSVGIILCKNKDTKVVEYALSRSLSPALVSKYETSLFDKKLLERKLDEFYKLAEPASNYMISE